MTDPSQIALSVVDQSPMRKGGTPSEALWESVKLAQHAETLGYSRYWVAEHHNSTSFAGTSPEILVGQIAAQTASIRIGSGGVMLSHYSALKVAEQFSVLGSLYPGRIDLGIGRAPGSDGLTAAALAFPRPQMNVPRDFPQMVEDLVGFLHGGLKESHPLAGIKVQPGGPGGTAPDVWLLGSSDYSARLAAAMGLPFSFADFFGNTGEHGPQVANIYRNEFRPSAYLSEPRVNVALQVICARTGAEARFIGASRSLNKINSALGLTTDGLLPPEEAIQWPVDDDAKAHMSQSTKSYIEGDLDEVREGILAAAERYQTSDIGIVTNCYYFEHRKRSYALVAECMGVTPAASGVRR
jgi:luciferase family oxidoreductase group 1